MMHGMTLILSHRSEQLIDCLSQRLRRDNPLSESWVLLPSLVNQQWLMLELIDRIKESAIAGVRFVSWREALKHFQHRKMPNRFDLELRLAQILSGDLPTDAKEALAPLLHWISGGPGRLSSVVRPLSRQILDASMNAVSFSIPWQQKLIELLAPDFSEERTDWPSSVGQIHCFCTDEMPRAAWELLIQKAPEVLIYLFSPCRMYWEDILSDHQRRWAMKSLKEKGIASASAESYENYLRDTHPLLANWGKLGRETLRHLDFANLETIETYDGSFDDLAAAQEKFRDGRLTLLQIIQQDLLLLRTPEIEPIARDVNDSSVQIHAAGSSIMREIQILKDNILHYLERFPGSSFSEILVLAPDIRKYEPIIQFVFGKDMPVRIAPVATLARSSFLQALIMFFDLEERNWDVDAVMELFETKAFQTKHRLTPEDLHWFRIWLKEASVRGSLEGRASWDEGLRRMVTGLVYLLPEEEPMPRVTSMDWGQAERLDLLIHLIHLLHKHTLSCQGRHTLKEWSATLKEVSSELLEAHDGDDEVFRSFLRKVAMASHRWAEERFASSLLRGAFQDDCEDAVAAAGAHAVDAIQFSSLLSGSIRPARAIFMIGMDTENFSCSELKSSLDWNYPKPSKGDQNRYLMLQALFAARDHFCISYNHISSHDGKTIDPALPVQELMQVIDAFYPANSSFLIVRHPAQPFDVRYFQKESLVCSYSAEDYRAAGQMPQMPHVFWPAEKIEREKIISIDLSDLNLLMRHPWKYFLQRTMKIYLKDESLFSEFRKDDFTLPFYQEQKLLQLALRQPIDEVLTRYSHLLPPGSFGEWTKIQLRAKAYEQARHLQRWGISLEKIFSMRFSKECLSETLVEGGIEAPPILIDFTDGTDSLEITGSVDFMTDQGLLMSSDLSLFSLLRQWPALLAALTLRPEANALWSLKKGKPKAFSPIDARDALRRLIQYARKAEESLSPLIFPWAEAFIRKGFEDWKPLAQKSLMKEVDLASVWVLERSQPLPFSRIWDEWNPLIQKTFSELLQEKEDADV